MLGRGEEGSGWCCVCKFAVVGCLLPFSLLIFCLPQPCRTQRNTHTHSLTHTRTLTHSHTHTHTHSLTHSHTHTHSFLIHCPLPSAQQMCRSKCSPSALQVTLAATTGRPCLGMVQSPFPLVRVFVVGGERVQSTCNRTNTKCGGKKARMTHSHSHSFTHSFTPSLHSFTHNLLLYTLCPPPS